MKFVIFSDSFDDQSGGIIALHVLCQRLSEAGEEALLWPARPRLQLWRNPRRYLGWLRYHLTGRQRRYSTGPFNNRLARTRDLSDAVVVYPEIVSGNPLKAKHVVRWCLHKPGFHTGKVAFGKDDLLFYYQDAFYDPALGEEFRGNRLTLSWLNQEYRQTNFGARSGSCYLLKKGKGRPLVHDLKDSVPVDALSHREKAAAFNRATYFYTYDAYTTYSRYAALCGCIPIIVPLPGVSREEWVRSEEERYGLAYGADDIDWAVRTRPLLLRRIEQEQELQREMLGAFVAKCRARFG